MNERVPNQKMHQGELIPVSPDQLLLEELLPDAHVNAYDLNPDFPLPESETATRLHLATYNALYPSQAKQLNEIKQRLNDFAEALESKGEDATELWDVARDVDREAASFTGDPSLARIFAETFTNKFGLYARTLNLWGAALTMLEADEREVEKVFRMTFEYLEARIKGEEVVTEVPLRETPSREQYLHRYSMDLLNFAFWNYQRGRTNEALIHVSKSIQSLPKFKDYELRLVGRLILRACILWRMERKAQALADLTQARETNILEFETWITERSHEYVELDKIVEYSKEVNA